MKTPDLTEYEAWLKTEGYQPSTITVALRYALTIAKRGGAVEAATYGPSIQRYLRYVEDTGKHPLGREVEAKLKAAGYKPSADVKLSGKRKKSALSRERWGALRSALRAEGSDESKLVIAYMHSGLRIMRFLELSSGLAQKPAFIADKLSRDWIAKKVAGKSRPLYRLVCDAPDSSRCAYARLRRKLIDVAEGIKLDVDLDILYHSRKLFEDAGTL
jgi:hypothetical protein